MSSVRIIVASGWMFLEPQEIIRRFHDTETGSGKDLHYENANHHFVVECCLVDADRTSDCLVSVIKDYLEKVESSSNIGNGDSTTTKITKWLSHDLQNQESENVWDLIERQALNLDQSNEVQLIPRVVIRKHFGYSHPRYLSAFSKQSLDQVSSHSKCDIKIDEAGKFFQLTGWSKNATDVAIKLLTEIEDRFERELQKHLFDFVDMEDQASLHLRLTWPTNIVDKELFHNDRYHLCEITTVNWATTSRQWRIARREPTPIPFSDGCTLWAEPLKFSRWSTYNKPSLSIKTLGEPSRRLSIQSLGRTIQWRSEISHVALGPNTNTFISLNDEDQSRMDHGFSYSRNTPGCDDLWSKSDASECHSCPASEHDGTSIETDLPSSRSRMEILASGHDDSSRPFVDFNRLQGPHKSQGFLKEEFWEQINNAHQFVMNKGGLQCKSSLSFELVLGRAYVYTLTIANPDIRPQIKSPAEPFQMDEWKGIFRTTSTSKGAQTLFSSKLASKPSDAEFLLNLKISQGERLFDDIPKYRDAWFQIHCRSPFSGVEIHVEIHDQGEVRFAAPSEDLGGINIHYPSRAWDCRWQLTARKEDVLLEHEESFEDLIRNVQVYQDSSAKTCLTLFSHSKMDIVGAFLVRETIHRSLFKDIRLCITHIARFNVHRLPGCCFLLTEQSENAANSLACWWEAKLVAPELQRLLQEKTKDNSKEEWDCSIGEGYFQSMLEMAAHIVPRMDSIGYQVYA